MELLKLLFILCFFGSIPSSRGQSQSGFISIDCGLEGDSNYTDDRLGLVYSPDAGFVDTGINLGTAPGYIDFLARRYLSMRNFPEGIRNCYSVGPMTPGGKYLIRAGFFYGNYDGKNQTPEFDIYLGGNFWQTVTPPLDDSVSAEIIAISPANKVQVCLVNTGKGIPFISVLEARPFLDLMYPIVNDSQSVVLSFKRANYGGSEILRYPVDPFDRFWYGTYNRTGWTIVAGTGNVTRGIGDTLLVPDTIMKTAAVASENLEFTATVNPGEKLYVFLHFMELQRLRPNETREFNVLANGNLWYGPYKPVFMTTGMLYTTRPGTLLSANFSFNSTENSTLPPMINAREVYGLRVLESLPTDFQDADAISEVKNFYRLTKNWQGDPCNPRNLTWQGLTCSYEDSVNPRITSLNLSNSRLVGGITSTIADLKSLISLDLSNNNLTGEIPSNLGNLPRLKVLVLKNNQLNGSIPDVLYQKSQAGTLTLR